VTGFELSVPYGTLSALRHEDAYAYEVCLRHEKEHFASLIRKAGLLHDSNAVTSYLPSANA